MTKIATNLFISVCLVALACNSDKKTGKNSTASEPGTIKAHICNAACKNGLHEYLHSEIGHTCSSACGKPHVCGEACKNGAHVYAHGEVGHYCMCQPNS